jgi:hypothetical protein
MKIFQKRTLRKTSADDTYEVGSERRLKKTA